MIEYKYHCQHQAEAFSKAVISVPGKYPLREGLPAKYARHFLELSELARDIYMDMAKSPEAYGLMLVDIESKDHNLARDGYRTIHRFVDTLSALCLSGELKKHELIVSAEDFNREIKKGRGAVSGPVPKYELVLSQLVQYGFCISGFDGKPFSKKIESFTVTYPRYPEIIDAIKIYCDCWDKLKNDRSSIKLWPKEFHHHYYRFDYKITADCEKIPMTQWLSDEADYLDYPAILKDFSLKFYDYSLKYKDVKFDGDYNYKSKRIARITQTGRSALNENQFKLSVKLPAPDKSMEAINKLPESLQKHFVKNYCQYCSFQGATREYCKFRMHWNFKDIARVGCSHRCFYFTEFDSALIRYYWKMLELQYGLKESS